METNCFVPIKICETIELIQRCVKSEAQKIFNNWIINNFQIYAKAWNANTEGDVRRENVFVQQTVKVQGMSQCVHPT